MLALATLLGGAWLYYLFVVNTQIGLQLDAALAGVPSGFARVLKGLTLLAIFLIPALLAFNLLTRLGAALDAPPATPEQLLEAVREGHRRSLAGMRAIIDTELARSQADKTLSDLERAELRKTLEDGLRYAEEDAARKEQRYAADPALMRKELVATLDSMGAQQRGS